MTTAKARAELGRRAFLWRSLAGAVGMACAGRFAHGGQTRAEKPNIVFIIADDMGWADVGYHGSVIQTPNIDRLAAGGVRFDRQYVMPTCTPTRIGLLTGRYPSRYGVTSPAYGEIFDDDTVTLGEALRRGGYTTHISGKWHMGSPPQWTPRRYGFDSSYGYFHGQIDPYTRHYKTGVRSWHRDDAYLDEKGHATDLITDEALRVIESKHDKPFFLYVAYSVPHYPLAEPEQWTSLYEGKIAEPSRRWLAASITHMDEGIGRIVEALEKQNLRENTLVVFVSDNGGQKSWQSKEQYKGRYADKPHTVLGDNRPLRGWKGDVYEGGVRVPALANWPGVLKPAVCETAIHIVDWMPTLCALAGYVPERDLDWDGGDVWPSIKTGRSQVDRLLYWKAPRFSAVRSGDWKLIVKNDGTGAELYDLAADPYETTDLASEQPDRVLALKGQWKRFTAQDR
jgi:arylsulfatase B